MSLCLERMDISQPEIHLHRGGMHCLGGGDLVDPIGLDDVAFLDVPEPLETYAALKPGRDFGDVILHRQQRRLHQDRRPVTEAGTHRGGVGNPGGVGQLEFGDLGKRLCARFRPQVADVVRAESQASEVTAQDGLTPVSITL